jgi:hypothetical protein
MTGKNVPSEFEEATIGTLLVTPAFCEYFGLDADDRYLDEQIVWNQRRADNGFAWGEINKIDLDDA